MKICKLKQCKCINHLNKIDNLKEDIEYLKYEIKDEEESIEIDLNYAEESRKQVVKLKAKLAKLELKMQQRKNK